MTRRRFLLSIATLTILSGVGSYKLWLHFQPATLIIAAALRRNLGDLIVSPEDVRLFAADHAQRISRKERLALSLFAPLAPLYVRIEKLARTVASERLRRFEELVVTKFLLGTDLFASGADESRPLRYTGYPDPYLRPCGNPIARFR
jgi:hypothetical protein